MRSASSWTRTWIVVGWLLTVGASQQVVTLAGDAPTQKKVAAIVTEYRHNSHADVIVSRLFQSQTLDDKGPKSGLKLESLFTDQIPASDTSRKWAKQYGFPIFETIPEAITLGSGKLAVEGVLLVA